MGPERPIVRHWQLVMLAYTCSLLVGALPAGAATPQETMTPGADPPASESAGGKIRPSRRPARRVEPDAAPGAGVALPLGSAAAVLEAVVARHPTARAGRAPRPR